MYDYIAYVIIGWCSSIDRRTHRQVHFITVQSYVNRFQYQSLSAHRSPNAQCIRINKHNQQQIPPPPNNNANNNKCKRWMRTLPKHASQIVDTHLCLFIGPLLYYLIFSPCYSSVTNPFMPFECVVTRTWLYSYSAGEWIWRGSASAPK